METHKWWQEFPYYQDQAPSDAMWEEAANADDEPSGSSLPPPPAAPTARVADEEFLKDSTLVSLAVELWRLECRIERLDSDTHARERKMFADSAKRIAALIEQFDVEFEDPTGQMYMTGQSDVEVVAWEEPEGAVSPHGSGSWIKKAMRPIVRRGNRRLAVGQVVVIDAEDE